METLPNSKTNLKQQQAFLKKEKKKKLSPFLIFFLFALLISTGYFFIFKKPVQKPQVLATVNGEKINKDYLEEKQQFNCFINQKEGKTLLDTIIDFLILKQGAKDLGIEVSENELLTLFDKKSFPKIEKCSEEFLKDVLKNRLIEKITPSRQIEALVLSTAIPVERIEEVILSVEQNQFSNLFAAANSFLANEKIEGLGSPSFYSRQLTVTPDSLNQGVFVDENLFTIAYQLKTGQISKPLKVVKGPLKDQIVVLRVMKTFDSGEFSNFESWWQEVKKKAEIKIYE